MSEPASQLEVYLSEGCEQNVCERHPSSLIIFDDCNEDADYNDTGYLFYFGGKYLFNFEACSQEKRFRFRWRPTPRLSKQDLVRVLAQQYLALQEKYGDRGKRYAGIDVALFDVGYEARQLVPISDEASLAAVYDHGRYSTFTTLMFCGCVSDFRTTYAGLQTYGEEPWNHQNGYIVIESNMQILPWVTQLHKLTADTGAAFDTNLLLQLPQLRTKLLTE